MKRVFHHCLDEVSKLDVFPPFTGGVDEATINREEKKLGLPITGSYREFILRFGSQQDEGFIGIDILYGGTVSQQCKKFWKKGLPASHIHFFFKDTTCYSLNTEEPTGNGEFSVYQANWYTLSGPFKKVADSFGELFAMYFGVELPER